MSQYGFSTSGLDGSCVSKSYKGKGMKNCRKKKREKARREERIKRERIAAMKEELYGTGTVNNNWDYEDYN
jgi:hypothetical protein